MYHRFFVNASGSVSFCWSIWCFFSTTWLILTMEEGPIKFSQKISLLICLFGWSSICEYFSNKPSFISFFWNLTQCFREIRVKISRAWCVTKFYSPLIFWQNGLMNHGRRGSSVFERIYGGKLTKIGTKQGKNGPRNYLLSFFSKSAN